MEDYKKTCVFSVEEKKNTPTMGRYKRKKQRYAKQQQQEQSDASSRSSSSGSSSIQEATKRAKTFSHKDRKLLLLYLQQYYEEAYSVYHTGHRKKKRPFLESSFSSNDREEEKEQAVLIGGQAFPNLTMDVLRKPYLALPEDLSGKQRRVVHETCIDVGLFHCSVSLSYENRFVAVSIYRDGLSYVPNIRDELMYSSTNSSKLDFKNFKPWACRRTNTNGRGDDPLKITDQAREAIYRFIDQPGVCLRSGTDSIDFRKIEHEDLSHTLPPGFASEEWMLVNSREKLQLCIQEIKEAKPTEIAFDLECYNQSKYTQLTCLIQLALNNGKEYVIDPLAPGVWESVSGLAPFFANPDIVKVGHSIGGLDVRCLHRDFGIFVVNAFDTYEAACCLPLRGKGLAKVCAHYGLPDREDYESLKETYQRTDWTKRPLTPPMLQYGRYDVHYLIQLRRLMMRDLAKQELWDVRGVAEKDAEARQVATSLADLLRGFDEDEETFLDNFDPLPSLAIESTEEDGSLNENGEEKEEGERQSFFDAKELRMNIDLMQVISRSQERCLHLWNEDMEPHLKDSDFQSLLKGEVQWTTSQLELYDKLAHWRERVAAQEECTGGFVCPLGLLASIALTRPTSDVGLRRLNFHLPKSFEIGSPYRAEMIDLVRESRLIDGLSEEDCLEIPCYNDYLQRERSGNFSQSKALVSVGGWTFAGIASCAALLLVSAMMASKRGK